MQLHKFERPHDPLSVAEVCRQSGVNRSNLYATHPDLVASILRRPINANGETTDSRTQRPPALSNVRSKNFSLREKALLYLCLELQAEIESLRSAGGRRVSQVKKQTSVD